MIDDNFTIFDSFAKADSVLNSGRYETIAVSVSGGSDSDILIDLILRVYKGPSENIHFVYFDTGLEFEATKKQLNYLESKYNISIDIRKAIMPIPMCVRVHGVPFVSKQVSEMIMRLQRHNFDFATADDFTIEEQLLKYPKCQMGIKWFYNGHNSPKNKKGDTIISKFNIARNPHLREFLIQNPPKFKISPKCCTYAKKKVGSKYQKDLGIDLSITGVRKSEGGTRSNVAKCFIDGDSFDNYRPIFWYNNDDKKVYNSYYDITNSACYTEYGMSRTGCAGCPFARDFESELEIIKTHEPKLYKAVNNIFGESYEYTRAYKKFQNKQHTKVAR